jgi:predicted DNA-binding transcriptional regulator AlpA
MAVEALLTEAQVSEILGRGVPTLQKDRVAGTGPRFVKMGRLVRYRPSDVQAWLDERIRQSTSDQSAIRGPAGEAAAPTRRLSLGKFHDPSAREIFGGGFGVFQLPATGTTWTRLTGLNDNLPPALVLDLHYDYSDSVLAAGTLGRGSWTIAGPFTTGTDKFASSKKVPRPNGPVSSLPLLRHLPPAPPPSANVPPSTAPVSR